jgi:hypothetical protein
VLVVYLLLAAAVVAWARRSRTRRTPRADLPPSALART